MTKNVLVSGASSGLGYSLCKKLIEENYNVIGISRTLGSCKNFIKFNNFQYLKCDISEQDSINKLIDKLRIKKVRVNILINNAGVFNNKPNVDLSNFDVNNLIKTNTLGTINLTRSSLNSFPKNLKKIINILSVAALKGNINQTAYSASKHALRGYFNSLAQEMIDRTEIINFYPGGIKTKLWNSEKINQNKLNKFMSPESVAKYVLMHLSLPSDIYVKDITFFPRNDWH